MPDTPTRAEVLHGLHEFADFLAAHPALDVPRFAGTGYTPGLHAVTPDPAEAWLDDLDDDALRLVPVGDSTTYVWVVRSFGPDGALQVAAMMRADVLAVEFASTGPGGPVDPVACGPLADARSRIAALRTPAPSHEPAR